jgi:hypothetical protein
MTTTKISLSSLVLAIGLLALRTMAEPVAADEPLDISDRAQLAADKTWIQSADGIDFSLHPAEKHPGNPVLKADKPWEGWRVSIYGTVLYDEDEKLFKMWYIGDMTEDFPTFATYYATSKDGINWTKPNLGAIKSATGSTDHNAVADSCLLPSVIYDEADPNPAHRYKMLAWVQKLKPEGGPHTFVSPDGIHWTRLSKEPICRSSDVITGYYDETRELYVAYPKLSTAVRGEVRRCFGITTSTDFLNWTPSRYVFKPDELDDAGTKARIEAVRPMLDVDDDPQLMRTEFYGVGTYIAESCTVAFPWVFTINNNARYGNHEGPSEIQLAVSRDLKGWDRAFRAPIIPRGKPGDWDSGFFTSSSRALRVGDEVWLYYSGANYTHGTPCLYREEGTGRGTKYTSSIGLAKWKLDRFVSADGPTDGAVVVTKPLLFSGDYLELNAKTAVGGEVTVELVNSAGTTLSKSKPFIGDDLRHRVAWSEAVDLEKLSGQPVTLRFHLKSAELFAFAFRKSPPSDDSSK